MWTSVEVLLHCTLSRTVRLLPQRRLHRLREFHQVFRRVVRREGIIYDHIHASDLGYLHGYLICASE